MRREALPHSLCTLMETQQCLHLMDAVCNRTVFKLYMELSHVVHLQEREEDPVISYDSMLIRVYQVDTVGLMKNFTPCVCVSYPRVYSVTRLHR